MNTPEKNKIKNELNAKKTKISEGKILYIIIDINFEINDLNELDRDVDEKGADNVSRTSSSRNEEINRKSVVVRNVDLDATIDEIEKLFSKFGLVNKVTLICDKYTGKSKGTAFVEYESVEAKDNSKELNNHLFQKKQIRVGDKKQDIPTHFGRREKCYNIHMEDYFSSTKNNFGPIKIKKSLKKRYEPY